MIEKILSNLETCYSCRKYYYQRISELKKENDLIAIEILNKMLEINQIHIEEHKSEILKILGIERDLMLRLITYFNM